MTLLKLTIATLSICVASTTLAAPSGGWTEWQSIGGNFYSEPAACSRGKNYKQVWVIAEDRTIHGRYWTGTQWYPWFSLGGDFKWGPACVVSASNRTDVFALGSDNALWQRTQINGTWSAWMSHGGSWTSGPAAASWGAGRLDVFIRGMDYQYWHKSWDQGTWSNWESTGGGLNWQFYGNPGAVAPAPGQLELFGVVDLQYLAQRTYISGTWQPGWLLHDNYNSIRNHQSPSPWAQDVLRCSHDAPTKPYGTKLILA